LLVNIFLGKELGICYIRLSLIAQPGLDTYKNILEFLSSSQIRIILVIIHLFPLIKVGKGWTASLNLISIDSHMSWV